MSNSGDKLWRSILATVLPFLAGLLFAPSVAVSATPELEAKAKQFPIVSGTVVGVRSDSALLLNPFGEGNQTIIAVRQWGYEIDPKLLSLSVLGRKVTCSILYDDGDIRSGSCSLQFFSSFEASMKWRGADSLDSISMYYGVPLRQFLKTLGIGRYWCSDQDWHFFSELPQEPPFRRDHYLERCEYFIQIETEEDDP